MRCLLDTHVVLWQLGGRRLSAPARESLLDAEVLYASAVSFAEIGIKVALGKLAAPRDLVDHVLAAGLHLLPLTAEHGMQVAGLPLHHRDPFDRLLVAQAQLEDLTVITADPAIARYDVDFVMAGA